MAIEDAYSNTLLKFTEEIARLRNDLQEAREVGSHLFAIVKELPADLSELDPYFLGIIGDDDHWLWN